MVKQKVIQAGGESRASVITGRPQDKAIAPESTWFASPDPGSEPLSLRGVCSGDVWSWAVGD